MVGTMRRLPSAAEPWPGCCGAAGALPHGGEGRGHVARRAAGQPGMHAHRGVEIGIGLRHDGGRRTAGGQPGDVDTPRVDRVVAHDLAGDAGDQRGLALIALLVAGAEPVPALLGVGRLRLARIDDQAAMLLGERVHPRAGGEVVGRLGAAVQHDDQRHRLAAIGAGDVELVAAASGLAAEGPGHEPGALRQRLGRRAMAPWVSPPRPCASPPWLIWSRKPRSASGICGIVVVPRPPAGRWPASPRAAPQRGATPRPSRDRRR